MSFQRDIDGSRRKAKMRGTKNKERYKEEEKQINQKQKKEFKQKKMRIQDEESWQDWEEKY